MECSTDTARPDVTTAAFGRFLKTVMSTEHVLSALEAFATKRYINRHFTLHYKTETKTKTNMGE